MGPRAGPDRYGKSHPTGIRSPDRPARSHSLYRLSYPAHRIEPTLNIYLFSPSVPAQHATGRPLLFTVRDKGHVFCEVGPTHKAYVRFNEAPHLIPLCELSFMDTTVFVRINAMEYYA